MPKFIQNLKVNRKLSSKRFWMVIITAIGLVLITGILLMLYTKNKQVVPYEEESKSNNQIQALNNQHSSSQDINEDFQLIAKKVNQLKTAQALAQQKSLNNNESIINNETNKNTMVPPIIPSIPMVNNQAVQKEPLQNELENQKEKEYRAALKSAGKVQLSSISIPDAGSLNSNKNLQDSKTGASESFLTTENNKTDDIAIHPSKGNYVLYTGSYIPAVMDSELNSDIAGQVVAMVRTDVFDSNTHKNLLIPQGSKLVGKYDNNISYGQNRLMVAWNKLYYPDGRYIDLKAQPSTDISGANGLHDQVDNHAWKIWSSSFLIGTITAAMQYSQNNTNPNVQVGGIGITTTNPNPTQTLAGSLGQQLGQTGLTIVQKGLNIPPTIIIRRGYMFNIQTLNDIVFKAN